MPRQKIFHLWVSLFLLVLKFCSKLWIIICQKFWRVPPNDIAQSAVIRKRISSTTFWGLAIKRGLSLIWCSNFYFYFYIEPCHATWSLSPLCWMHLSAQQKQQQQWPQVGWSIGLELGAAAGLWRSAEADVGSDSRLSAEQCCHSTTRILVWHLTLARGWDDF